MVDCKRYRRAISCGKCNRALPLSIELEDNPVVVRTGIVVHMDQTKIPLRELFQDLANDLVFVIDPHRFAEGDEKRVGAHWFICDGRRGKLIDPTALIVLWEIGSDFRYSPLVDIAPENDDLPEIVTLIQHVEE